MKISFEFVSCGCQCSGKKYLQYLEALYACPQYVSSWVSIDAAIEKISGHSILLR